VNNPIANLQTSVSKKARLTRLTYLIRIALHPIYIFDGLERYSNTELYAIFHPKSAFALAASDPLLRDIGLKDGTVGTAKEFFSLTDQELQQFSCDCGGDISNEDMIRRIENIAANA
jgi:hypothetical protein